MVLSQSKRILYTLEELILEKNSLDLGKIQELCNCPEAVLKEIIATELIPHSNNFIIRFENDLRDSIFQYIQHNPGSYNRKIRDDLEIHPHEFDWHSHMLERYGFIKKVKVNIRQYAYFENRSYLDHEFDLFLLQNPKVKSIIEYLKEITGVKSPTHGYTKISDITNKTHIHYNTAKKYIETLNDRDILSSLYLKNSNEYVYSLNTNTIIKLRKIINRQAFLDFGEPAFITDSNNNLRENA